MAPGGGRRRGGAKGGTNKNELKLGDLVLAKVKGFPAWPAKIARPEAWEKTPDPKKCFVHFFGTNEIAFVAPANIQAFTVEAKNKVLDQCKGKPVKYFADAVTEICEAFEGLEDKSSSGIRADTNKSDFGSEAPSIRGLVDDTRVGGFEDTSFVNRQDGDSQMKGSEDHSFLSERCSQRQNEVNCQVIKPSTSHDTDTNMSTIVPLTKKNKLSKEGDNLLKEEETSASSQYNLSCPKEELVCRKNSEGTAAQSKNQNLMSHSKGLNTGKHSKLTDGEIEASGLGKKNRSAASGFSVHNTMYLDGRHDEIRNGKKMTAASKRKLDDVCDNYDANVNIKSGEIPMEGSRKKMSLSGGVKDTSSDIFRLKVDVVNVKKSKQASKGTLHLEGASSSQEDAKETCKEHLGDVSGKKIKHQLGKGKQTVVIDEVTHPVKRSKYADVAVDHTKGSLQKNKNSGDFENKAGEVEHNRSLLQGKTDKSLASRAEEVLPPSKRQRQAQEEVPGSSTSTFGGKIGKDSRNDLLSSDKVKAAITQFSTKRRAVRLFDDEDDEKPKTPVHGGSAKKVDPSSRVSDSLKSTSAQRLDPKTAVLGGLIRKVDASLRVSDSLKSISAQHAESKTPVHGGSVKKVDASLHVLNSVKSTSSHSANALDRPEEGSAKVSISTVKQLNASLSPESVQHAERPKKAANIHVSCSPGKTESDTMSVKEAEQILVCPTSPLLLPPLTLTVESVKDNTPLLNVLGNISQLKSPAAANKRSVMVSDVLEHSPNQEIKERSKTVLSVERPKSTPRSGSRINDTASIAGKLSEVSSITGKRVEKELKGVREDKMSALTDSKIEDSAKSMKHLIAVAQAKRKEAHSQFFHENFSGYIPGSSPIFSTVVPPILSGSSYTTQLDLQGSVASPSSNMHQLPSNNHPDIEGFEDQKLSSEHHAAGDSFSGGTEAAVARDTFEGMIETLSRTKESIGRATRLAIECAKYGIANEVVEVLIRKLETETSLHRKVDLFFLVDSITQCSHNQKGIAGASYIPVVQDALPRLLGAAAPPEAGARENRRQCLKVLRLWLERKILPESLLRNYMDNIGVSNDDTSAGFLLRHPSRAERAIDDPIREMEGMLVDEYGSNATFQLPGFVTYVFEDDEEEEEELGIFRNSCVEDDERSAMETTCTVGDAENFPITPNDRRHCILEDVDGELEMEDVSDPKEENTFLTGASFGIVSEGQFSDMIHEAASNSLTELEFLPKSSPSFPLDSPPPTPPMPSSPPPSPPPLPSSPSPPPPPLLSQTQAHPPLPTTDILQSEAQYSSLISQPSIGSQYPYPFQSSLPSSSPKLEGTQFVKVTGNIRNETLPSSFASSGVYNLQEPSGYNSSRHLDYSHNDLYTHPQTTQPNQQFQPGSLPSQQRVFHPALPTQAPSSHFSYSVTLQQHPQHPYPTPYLIPTHSAGPKPYGTNEKWRLTSNELNTDNPHFSWMSGVRSSSGSVTAFPQEGYFRPPLERTPTNNVGYQPYAVNTISAGPPRPADHGESQIPSNPDLSSLGSWRPA